MTQFEKDAKASFGEDFDLFYELTDVVDHKVDVDSAWNKLNDRIIQPKQVRSSMFSVWKVAAVLIFGLLLSGIVYQFQTQNSPNRTLSSITSSSPRQIIDLPDGSRVTLAKGAQIQFDKLQFIEKRNISLSGVAYFEVVKSNNPFSIKSTHGTVEVIGTSFNVNTQDRLHVTVNSGVVQVSSTTGQVKVEKGNSAIVEQDGSISSFQTQNDDETVWKTGHFRFENKELQEIIPLLESYYDVKIQISKSLKTCKITAEFKESSLTSVVDVITSVLNAKSRIGNKKVKISGKGCN